MYENFGLHSGMGIFQRIASYQLRGEMEDGDRGVVDQFRVRAELLGPPKVFYAVVYSR